MPADASELRKLAADLTAAAPKARTMAALAVAKTARDIEGDAKTLAPVDTGALKNSISADIDDLTASIGPTMSYGVHLEFGTSRMAPRPYMGPATDRREPGFVAAIEQIAGGLL